MVIFVVTKDIEENKFVSKSENLMTRVYMICITLVAIMAIGALIIYIINDNKNVNSKTVSNKVQANNSKTDSEENDEISENSDNTGNDDLNSVDGLKTLIKDYMSEGKGTIDMLREIYPENIVVYDNNKFVFMPVDDSLEKNSIDKDCLRKLESGEIVYEKDEEVTSIKGIDVSKYQGEIDWEKVAKDGVEYAIIRLGYRGYGTGAIVLDENALKNIEGATKAGIDVGVYFFSQAITEAEGVEEAEFVLEKIKGYDISYPIVFDTEDVYGEDARADSLSKSERTDIAIAFCDTIEEAGYTPVVYANLKWFTLSLDISRLEKYDKWFAYYDDEIYFPYEIDIWQYSESGQVSGIEGPVDMNISFKEW